jgi:hypothetical protein
VGLIYIKQILPGGIFPVVLCGGTLGEETGVIAAVNPAIFIAYAYSLVRMIM